MIIIKCLKYGKANMAVLNCDLKMISICYTTYDGDIIVAL